MLETSWLWFVISKEYVELTRPKIESRDPIFYNRAREFPGMIGCFRTAPNLGPTSKSLLGPQFSYGLDLLTKSWKKFDN